MLGQSRLPIYGEGLVSDWSLTTGQASWSNMMKMKITTAKMIKITTRIMMMRMIMTCRCGSTRERD